MVEDTISDGERIATLLRAEIEDRETAGIDRLGIVDGTRIVVEGRPFATLEPDSDGLTVTFLDIESVDAVTETVESASGSRADLSIDRISGAVALQVESAAAIKPALDTLVALST